MSWLRTAVNRAVEAGGQNQLRRTVRSYADTVVVHAGNAVAGGARILQDRIGFRNLQGFKHTVKRLEEVSVSCRGVERVQLLRRWLVALKQVERLSTTCYDHETNDKSAGKHPSFDESKDYPKKPTLEQVLYVDSAGDEPKNFLDVFLYSQALEGMTLSMILEAPNEEEVSLLLEIYGLCLTGGKEVHNAVMRKVQDLAEVFSGYQEEVLIKREELLQFAQGAIAGLKVNTDLARLDAEACSIREKLYKMKFFQHSSNEGYEKSDKETTLETVEDVDQALADIRLCFKLEAILLKKKLLRNGDPPEIHAEKVYKLKILLESLANSTSKAEKRILDHRSQKEEALGFRVAKSNEVHQFEKEMVAEIRQLEMQRDELEAELKKVKTSLAAAHLRLHNAREERDQFDEASNQILVHLKTKEDELLRSIASCRAEAGVVDTWINFLDETWVLQTSYTEQKEKQVMYVNLPSSDQQTNISDASTRGLLLLTYIRSKIPLGEDDGSSTLTNTGRDLEEEYLDVEAKFLTTMSVVETMKRQFYAGTEGIFRKDDQRIKDLFEAIEMLKEEFESIKRPTLKIDIPTQRSETAFNSKNNKSPSTISKETPETPKHIQEIIDSSLSKAKKTLESEAELTELGSELGNDGRSDSAEDINDWEFDALEKD
ncbi:centrosomal protein of 135 kDa-like protein [Parasponia andersonii]|uniref:Centrosomal protein of 135 kDa-like protein n=1 Tax=Parasponia andersonii TaxID=3476 RepID=A0A2P5DHM4_PARAD|nr:centrosomal protein of 135 kDa-like protein [Parasponia andersonii]